MQRTEIADSTNHPFDWSHIRISREARLAFFCAAITFFLTHLSSLTNLLNNSDSIVLYFSSLPSLLSGATSGRWLLEIVEEIASPFRMAVVSGVLNMLSISLIAALTVRILRIRSKLGCALIAALIASLPAVAMFNLLFSVAYPISALLAVAAVYFVTVEKPLWPVSTLLLFLCISIFPVHIAFYILLCSMFLIRSIFTDALPVGKPLLRQLLRFVLPVLIAGVLLYLITKAFVAVGGASSYQGFDAAMNTVGLLRSLPANILTALKRTCSLAYYRSETIPAFRITLVLSYCMDIAFVAFLFIKGRCWRRPSHMLLLIACIVLLPLALSAMTLISPEFRYRAQHRFVWALLYAFTVALGEITAERTQKWRSRAVAIVCSVTMAAMCYGQFMYCNMIYLDTQYTMQKDTALMTRVMAGLEREEDFTLDSPVLFVREVADYSETTSIFALDEDLYQNLITTGDTLFCYFPNIDILAYLKNYMGIVLSEPSGPVKEEIYASGILDDLPALAAGEYQILQYKDVFIVRHRMIVPYYTEYKY